MAAVILLGVYIFTSLKLSLASAGSCRPIIGLSGHNNGFDIGSTAVLECQFPDCNAATNIRFELKGFASTWVTIYEYRANIPGNDKQGSDLEYEYAALDSRHFLEIKNLTLHHHGLFKCVVNDGGNGCYESNQLELNINVIPGKVGILPKAPNLVQHQVQYFTCSGEGIHPEPDVIWVLNGVTYRNGSVTNEQRDDGLWSVNNSIQLAFDKVGENRLACTMKTTTGDRWMQDSIKLDIKDAAKVLYPVHDVSMKTESTSTFTLNCRGTGYKPTINWEKDGVSIQADGSKFIIKDYCTPTICNGSISSTPISQPLQNGDVGTYDGVYKCIITLQPPYKSTDMSSKTHINVLYFTEHIDEPPIFDTFLIRDAVLIAIVVYLIGAALFYIRYRWKKNKPRKRRRRRTMESGLEMTDGSIPGENSDTDSVFHRTSPLAINENRTDNMSNENLISDQNEEDIGALERNDHDNPPALEDRDKMVKASDSGMESNGESDDDTGKRCLSVAQNPDCESDERF